MAAVDCIRILQPGSLPGRNLNFFRILCVLPASRAEPENRVISDLATNRESQVTGSTFDGHRGGETSRALEPALARLRKNRRRPEVLNALVLRVLLSRGLDSILSLLADQSRQDQNHPAPRTGCLAHPARLHFPD